MVIPRQSILIEPEFITKNSFILDYIKRNHFDIHLIGRQLLSFNENYYNVVDFIGICQNIPLFLWMCYNHKSKKESS